MCITHILTNCKRGGGQLKAALSLICTISSVKYVDKAYCAL